MLGWLRKLIWGEPPPTQRWVHHADPADWDDGWPSRPGPYDPPDALMFPCDCSPNVPGHLGAKVRIRHTPDCRGDCYFLENHPDELGRLAFRFRDAKDECERNWIARQYADVVAALIESGKWHEAPPPEDQLPCAYMPPAFAAHFKVDPCLCRK